MSKFWQEIITVSNILLDKPLFCHSFRRIYTFPWLTKRLFLHAKTSTKNVLYYNLKKCFILYYRHWFMDGMQVVRIMSQLTLFSNMILFSWTPVIRVSLPHRCFFTDLRHRNSKKLNLAILWSFLAFAKVDGF